MAETTLHSPPLPQAVEVVCTWLRSQRAFQEKAQLQRLAPAGRWALLWLLPTTHAERAGRRITPGIALALDLGREQVLVLRLIDAEEPGAREQALALALALYDELATSRPAGTAGATRGMDRPHVQGGMRSGKGKRRTLSVARASCCVRRAGG